MFEFFTAKREKFPASRLALARSAFYFFGSLAALPLKFLTAKRGKFPAPWVTLARSPFYFSARLPSAFLKNFRRSLLNFLTRLDRSPLDSAKLFGQARAARSGGGSRAFFRFTAPSPAGGWPTVSQGWLHQPGHRLDNRHAIARCSSDVRQPSPRSSFDVRLGIV